MMTTQFHVFPRRKEVENYPHLHEGGQLHESCLKQLTATLNA